MSEAQSTVRYAEVPGHPGYRVGDDGSLWSQWLAGCTTRIGTVWVRRKGTTTVHGYARYSLSHPVIRRYYAQRLVLTAFVGPCPHGMEACHNDGNPANNNLTNLRWDTVRSNVHDAIRHGTFIRGERVGSAILTATQVEWIRATYSCGTVTMKSLADQVQVSENTVRHIVHRRTWKHVP